VEVAAQPDDGYALAFGSSVLAEFGERDRAEEWAARASGSIPMTPSELQSACTYAQSSAA
jgi:hypothetical protein